MKKWEIGALFAILYFMQGIVEPSDGLVAQPVRAMLRDWGRSAAEITSFVAWISLPWAFKVGFGFLIDFVPIFGSRRKSYLLITTAWCAMAMLAMYVFPPVSRQRQFMLLWMMGLNFAVSCSDVAADALMVEVGQPAGLTGRLQSIQWTANFAAGILSGYLGGYLSSPGRQTWSFLGCGVVSLISVAGVTLLIRREPVTPPPPNLRVAVDTFTQASRLPQMLSVAVFLLFCNFNPFSQALLYLHMTEHLKFSEIFYGQSVTYMSIASMLASAAYGLYCQRLSVTMLGHMAVLLGVVSTLAYLGLRETKLSALLITWVIGFTYQTANLAQLDLAARACPTAIGRHWLRAVHGAVEPELDALGVGRRQSLRAVATRARGERRVPSGLVCRRGDQSARLARPAVGRPHSSDAAFPKVALSKALNQRR